MISRYYMVSFNIAMENPWKSLRNGGFNGKIIYKWTIFHGELLNNQTVLKKTSQDELLAPHSSWSLQWPPGATASHLWVSHNQLVLATFRHQQTGDKNSVFDSEILHQLIGTENPTLNISIYQGFNHPKLVVQDFAGPSTGVFDSVWQYEQLATLFTQGGAP